MEGNIFMDLKEIWCEDVDYIQMAQDGDQRLGLTQ